VAESLEKRHRPGAAYNVCSGRGLRMTEIAGTLVSRARVPIRIEVDRARFRPADVPYLVGDPSAIRHDCGWQATRPVEQALDDLLTEWRGRAE
jgi:GDP-4-dehydro-6-deoxy-D-mannose reductase